MRVCYPQEYRGLGSVGEFGVEVEGEKERMENKLKEKIVREQVVWDMKETWGPKYDSELK